MPDVYIRCPACDGRRFRPEVLEVRVRGKNIAEILSLSAEEVSRLFQDNEAVVQALRPLLDIGLGYLSLSQPVPTLSGGESQRLKLAKHLAGAQENGNTLSSSMNRRRDCILRTYPTSWAPCRDCSTPATRRWSSNMTWTSPAPPIG